MRGRRGGAGRGGAAAGEGRALQRCARARRSRCSARRCAGGSRASGSSPASCAARETSPGTAGRRSAAAAARGRRVLRALPRGGGAVKHVTLARRAGGRFARRGTFRTLAGCGTIRDATLARPVFGGRGGKPLDIRFRLNTPARVEVTVAPRQAHRPPLRRPQPPGRPHDPAARARARGARRGAYRVTITRPPHRRAGPDPPPHRDPPLTPSGI